jgi:hypothetical protein
MKQVTLTIKEYYLFKQLATFFFDLVVNKDIVIVTANESDLLKLGY